MKPEAPPTPARHRFPWWLSILFAVLFYCGLKYLAPQLHTTSAFLNNLLTLAPRAAPLVAIVFLLCGAVGLYDFDEKENEKSDCAD
ncbi:hypothetical protein [Desulfomarina sp.]